MQSNRKKNDDLQSELSIEKKLLVGSEMELEKETLKINALEQTMLNNEAMRTDLMKQWQTENDRELPLAGTCHTCGQLLPEKMIFEQTDNFRREKAENLRKINTQGSNLHADYVKMQAKKQVIAEHIAKIESTIKKEKSEVERIEKAIHKINNENNKEYGKKQAEISTEIKGLEDKIEEMQGSIAPEKERLKTSISTLEDEKSVLDSKLLELTHAEKNRARIRELEAERKTAAQEYENFERETFLMDSFVKKKAEWIEQHVSNHFAITRWKLFDVQVNKGVRDICEPMLEGVPYSTDLNNGSKILCGLDCINAISKHKKISVPVFIDNAESLTDWLDFPHQHIRLIVDEKEKELKVSYD
jgi:chromosome segregation ATPase